MIEDVHVESAKISKYGAVESITYLVSDLCESYQWGCRIR